ncbi:CpsD/CapB family tyrosine-protein kinase [Melissococcus plutonius]|uniref:Tyrosine-protein kinase CpsD n=1 Tax=Melissococcus plutonius TaxID=33970 RepID=A0A2Z5Y3V4_9ENTE|nr:CpsD/CapB family tyrosine-protein kinase [Melissococcus plutonius]BAL62600.1 tyrosine-protein kinase EpsD [Melissococcus plutonius DAT561]MCV2498525.1 CpsD/CapB family tyrosine-protein kinase [Melissococcus plutonius]MCV2501084.1 CpsD/CapB family tyrosine-protein kinase [Melissococcus plutonius]MCV2504807.1 CpsD/CapB family tyrosine-protein kinase [Melissococcus plutonius]MCV2507267.1 CpsD/CapB family tyrosine-protein kinase [Melissococcus plutonius]
MSEKNSLKKQRTKPISLITMSDPASPISEQYRTIRTNIQYAMVDKTLQTLAITSSSASEGKSTSTINLAIVFANSNKKVLLVDADMRNPTIAKTFELINNRGLSTLLSNKTMTTEEVLQPTNLENLNILPSGPIPPNPSELLDSLQMKRLIEEWKNNYDLIIFDTPPILAVTDAQILASKVDGTILVAREKIAEKSALLKAKELLIMVKATIIGAIYNDASSVKDQGYYYGVK